MLKKITDCDNTIIATTYITGLLLAEIAGNEFVNDKSVIKTEPNTIANDVPNDNT